MSCEIRWNCSGREFRRSLGCALQDLLNAPGSLPAEVEGEIEVHDLDLGVQAPEVQLLGIREFGMERGFVFDLSLSFHPQSFTVTFKTKAQINPLYSKGAQVSREAEARPFTVPITIGIDQLSIEARVRVTFNPQAGACIEWINGEEPTVEFRVFSSFDDVAVIRNHLQSAIELKVREALAVDLPLLVREYTAALAGSPEEPRECNSQVQKKENLLLNASYSTPFGLFVVENKMFSKFAVCPEQEREREIGALKESLEAAPIVISFPVRSKIYHFLTTSALFLKDSHFGGARGLR